MMPLMQAAHCALPRQRGLCSDRVPGEFNCPIKKAGSAAPTLSLLLVAAQQGSLDVQS